LFKVVDINLYFLTEIINDRIKLVLKKNKTDKYVKISKNIKLG